MNLADCAIIVLITIVCYVIIQETQLSTVYISPALLIGLLDFRSNVWKIQTSIIILIIALSTLNDVKCHGAIVILTIIHCMNAVFRFVLEKSFLKFFSVLSYGVGVMILLSLQNRAKKSKYKFEDENPTVNPTISVPSISLIEDASNPGTIAISSNKNVVLSTTTPGFSFITSTEATNNRLIVPANMSASQATLNVVATDGSGRTTTAALNIAIKENIKVYATGYNKNINVGDSQVITLTSNSSLIFYGYSAGDSLYMSLTGSTVTFTPPLPGNYVVPIYCKVSSSIEACVLMFPYTVSGSSAIRVTRDESVLYSSSFTERRIQAITSSASYIRKTTNITTKASVGGSVSVITGYTTNHTIKWFVPSFDPYSYAATYWRILYPINGSGTITSNDGIVITFAVQSNYAVFPSDSTGSWVFTLPRS